VITTLLLDFDGVLGFHPPEYIVAMDREYAWRDGVAAFIDEFTHHPDEAAAIVGNGDILTLAESLLPEHVDGLGAEEFLDRWFAECLALDRDLLALIPQMRIERTFLATNQEFRRGSAIIGKLAGQSWLTGSLISCELGFAKPDPAYFTAALARIGARPDECVFIDDRRQNVDAATALGIPGIHFQGVPLLRTQLFDLDLI
jgi:putative hydrolase of the HAD superfamily